MHMIERLKQATETCEEADRFALLNQNPKRFGELDQLVVDADNQCRDFVRRHGREVMQILDELAAARLAIVEYGAHKGECAVTDIDDGGLHYYCDCGYEAAIDAAADNSLGEAERLKNDGD